MIVTIQIFYSIIRYQLYFLTLDVLFSRRLLTPMKMEYEFNYRSENFNGSLTHAQIFVASKTSDSSKIEFNLDLILIFSTLTHWC